ncbi:unnamed protein product [Notodromas monacha]|uniref:Uncharacterized protein n=1 Tax=Notodromas monacha TaxID=399045 RepID=A0A7R9BR37_9CRUS|nr:unnamed protein product [Notodromas monacha]CAG0919226.1 unnamed protein product [Notodromas monacha]
MRWLNIQVFLLQALAQVDFGEANCSFPRVILGLYDTQEPNSVQTGTLEYTEFSVNSNSMSNFGSCVEKLGSNFILLQQPGNCFRCVRIEFRTKNIVQLYTKISQDSSFNVPCFQDKESAKNACPSSSDSPQTFEEITLYRKTGFTNEGQESAVEKTFCPIAGQFEFVYRNTRLPTTGILPRVEACDRPTSLASNCPFGFGLTFDYQGCSFPDKRESFQCLGEWSGSNGGTYFALEDMQNGSPKYRCGMLREEQGLIFMSMATDSSCRHGLRSADDGGETWMLKQVNVPPSSTSCTFPTWSQGVWKDLEVTPGKITYKQTGQFQTLSMSCMQEYNLVPGMFFVQAYSSCGEEMFSCMWFKQRHKNILDIQMSPPTKTMNWTACAAHDQQTFNAWSSHPKLNPEEATCAFSAGEWVGADPNKPGQCVEVITDCRTSHSFMYTVIQCPDGPDKLLKGKDQKPVHRHSAESEIPIRTPPATRDERPSITGGTDWSNLFATRKNPAGQRPQQQPPSGMQSRAQVKEVPSGQVPRRRRPQKPQTEQPAAPGSMRQAPRPIWRSRRETNSASDTNSTIDTNLTDSDNLTDNSTISVEWLSTDEKTGNSSDELPSAKFSQYVQLRGYDRNPSRSFGQPYDPLQFHRDDYSSRRVTTPAPYNPRAPWHRAPSAEQSDVEDRHPALSRPGRWQDTPKKEPESPKFAQDDDIPFLEPGWSERKKTTSAPNRVETHAKGPNYFEYDLRQQPDGGHGGDHGDRPWQHPVIQPRLPPPAHPDHLPTEYKFTMVGGPQQQNQQPPSFHDQQWAPPQPPPQPPTTPSPPPVLHREYPPLQPEKKISPRQFFIGEEERYKCSGHWEEQGVTMAYAREMESSNFECLVVKTLSEDHILLQFSGETCQRNAAQLDSSFSSISLRRKGTSCPENRPTVAPSVPVRPPSVPVRQPIVPPARPPASAAVPPTGLPKLTPPRRQPQQPQPPLTELASSDEK